MKTERIKVSEVDLLIIEAWLAMDVPVSDAGECEVLKTYTADFGNGVEVDIKVCNGDTGAWIDAVIFDHGNEIGVLEPGNTILGEYKFEVYMYGTFIVVVE